MTDVPDIATLHRRIEATGHKLEELLSEIEQAGQQAASAEAVFKAEFAKARIEARASAAKVTEGQADDLATVVTEDCRLVHLIAANRLTTAREAMRARQSQLDALRSLLATFRAAGG